MFRDDGTRGKNNHGRKQGGEPSRSPRNDISSSGGLTVKTKSSNRLCGRAAAESFTIATLSVSTKRASLSSGSPEPARIHGQAISQSLGRLRIVSG